MKETFYTNEPALRQPIRFLADFFEDLRNCQELAIRLTLRDIKAQYRQSFIGYFWAFLPPLVSAFTFVVLQKSSVFTTTDIQISYPLYTMIGTLLWQTFVDALNNPIKVVGTSRSMLIKINFPRESLVLASGFLTGFNFLVRLAIIIPILIYFKVAPNSIQFAFPLGITALILLGTSFGLLLTPIGLLYNDVSRALTMMTGFWMFFTPVVLPFANSGFAALVMKLNPVSYVLYDTRNWLLGTEGLFVNEVIIITSTAFLLFILGWIIFRLSIPHVISRLGM